MKIVIPLAGKDKNFEERGTIKPLTKVQGKEIIKWIADSRPFPYETAIFIILKEHDVLYRFSMELKRLFGEKITIIILDSMTEGSPQSVLMASHLIDNDEPLVIDLADQYLDLPGFDSFMLGEFMKPDWEKFDGAIPTFESYYFNRGYMLIKEGLAKYVSEKDPNPISTHSTACISYFKKGSDFVKYSRQMIEKKKASFNGAYLPSLVYNEMIEDGKKIMAFPCELIATLGTTQGVDCFEQINRPLKWKGDSK